MNDRFPISGIKQSYRHTSETRTIIMPLLIVTLLGGMVAFYFLGKPETKEEVPVVEKDVSPETVEEILESVAAIAPVPTRTSPPTMSKLEAPRAPEPSIGMGSFTPWMTPTALDEFIREQNGNHRESFWKRGHWITAVEGRWNGENHEFRIAYDRTPRSPDWQWQYRVNQKPEEFLQNAKDLRARGFRIVQVQSFDHPDKRRRYQTVWERTQELVPIGAVENESQSPTTPQTAGNNPVIRGIEPPAASSLSIPEPPQPRLHQWIPAPLQEQPAVAEASGESAQQKPPSAGRRSLDVNNLQFR